MSALNLYSKIEQDLDFSHEISKLYDAYDLLINQINPSSLIDIGCGQGDFLLQLKNKNIKTFGIDLSSEQIKVCKQKGLDAKACDIKDIKQTYDIATAMFDVLNYIDKKNLKEFIQSTYECLNNDSYFIFDINTLFGFEEVAQGSLNINKVDKFIAIDAFFENKKLKTNITLFTKQSDNLYTKQEDFILQYYHKKEFLESELKKVGFSIENIIDFNLHDFEQNDKFIFICKK